MATAGGDEVRMHRAIVSWTQAKNPSLRTERERLGYPATCRGARTLVPEYSGVVGVGVLDVGQEIRTVSVKDHRRLACGVDRDAFRDASGVERGSGRGGRVPGNTRSASRGGAPCGVAAVAGYTPERDRGAAGAHREIKVVRILVGAGNDHGLPPGVGGEVAVHSYEVGELRVSPAHHGGVGGRITGIDTVLCRRP